LLDEEELLVFLVTLFFGTERPVLGKLLENIFIVKEYFCLFPIELVGVTLTNVVSTLELEDIEQRLPNSREFDHILMSEVSNLFFPLLWHKRCVDTTSTSY
jgi:hypothetical protein